MKFIAAVILFTTLIAAIPTPPEHKQLQQYEIDSEEQLEELPRPYQSNQSYEIVVPEEPLFYEYDNEDSEEYFHPPAPIMQLPDIGFREFDAKTDAHLEKQHDTTKGIQFSGYLT